MKTFTVTDVDGDTIDIRAESFMIAEGILVFINGDRDEIAAFAKGFWADVRVNE